MNERMTLMIIDDIKSVIEGISTGIPWAEYGIEVVGTSTNGEDGLRMIRDLHPNIVLTDIRMPRLNGLELTRQVAELLPACKVILLSGYADFEYAQAAIRYGAFDFVKKPFSKEEIIEAVRKAQQAIVENQRQAQSYQELEQRLKTSLPILRQEYFSLLLHHRTNDSTALERWAFLQVELDPHALTLMLIEIDDYGEVFRAVPVRDAELIRFSLQNIVEETVCRHGPGFIFRETLSRFVVLMNAGESASAEEVAEQIRANIDTYTKFTVTVGMCDDPVGLGQLPDAYRKALEALTYHVYTGGNAVILHSDIAGEGSSAPPYLWQREEEFAFLLRSGNRTQLVEWLREMRSEIRSMSPLPKPEYLMTIYGEWLSVVMRILQERLPYEQIEPLESRALALRGREGLTLQSLHEASEEICLEALALMDRMRVTESQATIHKAIAFIHANLHENLTVHACAEHVHLSGSYFASLFKKLTGTTFIQYVTQERIRRAKEMLLDGKQVQEVSQALGYEERRYFSDVFKKHTGMTPSEFRQANAVEFSPHPVDLPHSHDGEEPVH